MRLLNVLAAVLVVAALIGSGILILSSSSIEETGGIPAVTHDIQEPIAINGSSSITTNAQGSATFPLVIDTTWGPGFHLIVAEDVTSRSTASANLQITGEGSTPPAHLLIDTTPLAMGADVVGTNTIRSFTLANSGGGSITFTANSTIDSSQAVNVSVVVQPHCGLVNSTGFLAFTVVAGQNTPTQSTLTVMAQLTVQAAPPPSSPITHGVRNEICQSISSRRPTSV